MSEPRDLADLAAVLAQMQASAADLALHLAEVQSQQVEYYRRLNLLVADLGRKGYIDVEPEGCEPGRRTFLVIEGGLGQQKDEGNGGDVAG
jgi:hypothetical protein